MGDAPPRRLFRVVHTNPPTRSDFVSNAEAGIVPRRTLSAVERRLWRGVSCTETLTQARATARRAPILGTFVAALDLPATPRFRAERTGSRVGHYTAWSDANALLARVVSGGETGGNRPCDRRCGTTAATRQETQWPRSTIGCRWIDRLDLRRCARCCTDHEESARRQ
jgi:hypothetical protein